LNTDDKIVLLDLYLSCIMVLIGLLAKIFSFSILNYYLDFSGLVNT
jgi:hypothetical protein